MPAIGPFRVTTRQAATRPGTNHNPRVAGSSPASNVTSRARAVARAFARGTCFLRPYRVETRDNRRHRKAPAQQALSEILVGRARRLYTHPMELQNLHHRFDSGRRLQDFLLHRALSVGPRSHPRSPDADIRADIASAGQPLFGRKDKVCDSRGGLFLHRRDDVRVGVQG
jgi:hypothetical protein